MITIIRKELVKGMCELHDSERDEALRTSQSIKVQVDEEYMIISPTELRKGKVLSSKASVLNPGTKYKTYGFQWKPIKHENL